MTTQTRRPEPLIIPAELFSWYEQIGLDKNIPTNELILNLLQEFREYELARRKYPFIGSMDSGDPHWAENAKKTVRARTHNDG